MSAPLPPRRTPGRLCIDKVVLEFDTPTGVVRVLDQLDLDVSLGGVTAVVGPSGSGKSSLLRLCNRLEVPTSGAVSLDGVDLAAIDPLALRRRVGMVFQRPVVFAGTVAENLAVADPGITPDAVAKMLERCGLDPMLATRDADQLSGGEAQRMCMARTLCTHPEVVLMDEVTSSLDAGARHHVEALARSLADAGIAVVWVTHDLDQAGRLADRTVVVLDGRVAPPAASAEYLAGAHRAPRPGPDGPGAP